jgi:hypothetical protein
MIQEQNQDLSLLQEKIPKYNPDRYGGQPELSSY